MRITSTPLAARAGTLGARPGWPSSVPGEQIQTIGGVGEKTGGDGHGDDGDGGEHNVGPLLLGLALNAAAEGEAEIEHRRGHAREKTNHQSAEKSARGPAAWIWIGVGSGGTLCCFLQEAGFRAQREPDQHNRQAQEKPQRARRGQFGRLQNGERDERTERGGHRDDDGEGHGRSDPCHAQSEEDRADSQPAPNRAVLANSVHVTPAYAAAGCGMKASTSSQGTITMPTSE